MLDDNWQPEYTCPQISRSIGHNKTRHDRITTDQRLVRRDALLRVRSPL
jgi:hypothetical protein